MLLGRPDYSSYAGRSTDRKNTWNLLGKRSAMKKRMQVHDD